MGVIINL